MRRLVVLSAIGVFLLIGTPVWACAALIGARGSIQLGRTTTLAAYVDGKEHYITAFQFSGGGGQFGSIVPLPGIPEKVEKGGEWTLKRLVRETTPARGGGVAAGTVQAARSAEVIYETRIDALDLSVLKGGGTSVGIWAKDHGFLLPPDAPEVLDFYARRSPIFLAAVFDAQAANERGQQLGDGTPVHITMRTDNPWVPLRILALGKTGEDPVDADVYLLTQRKPSLLPVRAPGVELRQRAPASESLLADLCSDQGMEWLPGNGMWLTYMAINASAPQLRFDLAADVSGRGRPSYRMAGLPEPATPTPSPTPEPSPSPSPPPIPSPSPQVISVSEKSSFNSLPLIGLSMAVVVSGLLIVRAMRSRRA